MSSLFFSWWCCFNSFIGHILLKALKLSSTIASPTCAVPFIANGVGDFISSRAIRFLVNPKPIRQNHHLLGLLTIAPLIIWIVSARPLHFLRTSHTIAIYKTLISSSSLKSSLVSCDCPPLIRAIAVPFCLGFKLLDVRLIRIVEFAYRRALKLLRTVTNIRIVFSSLYADSRMKIFGSLDFACINHVVSCETLVKWFFGHKASVFGTDHKPGYTSWIHYRTTKWRARCCSCDARISSCGMLSCLHWCLAAFASSSWSILVGVEVFLDEWPLQRTLALMIVLLIVVERSLLTRCTKAIFVLFEIIQVILIR